MSIHDKPCELILVGSIVFFIGIFVIWGFTPLTPETPALIMLPNILWNLWMMIGGAVCYILGIALGLLGLTLALTEVEDDANH